MEQLESLLNVFGDVDFVQTATILMSVASLPVSILALVITHKTNRQLDKIEEKIKETRDRLTRS